MLNLLALLLWPAGAGVLGPNTPTEALEGILTALPKVNGTASATANLGASLTAIPALDGHITGEPHLTATLTAYPQ